jgi:hypothetical protein
LDLSQLGSKSSLALFKESDWLAIDISLQRTGSAQRFALSRGAHVDTGADGSSAMLGCVARV